MKKPIARRRTTARRTTDGGALRSRRQELFDVAVDLMCRQGYRGTTTKDIARALGVTEPALYYYVDSKEELLFNIYTETMNVALATMQSIRQSPEDPETKLRRVIAEFTHLVIENKMFRIFFKEKDELSRKNWKRITESERQFVRSIEEIIQEGIRVKVFRPQSPAVTAFGILGIAAWVDRWYRPGGQLSLDKIIAMLSEMVIHGTTVQEAKR